MAIGDSSDPNIPDHFPYKDFIQQFYSLIDAPHEHERYVNCFSPDASAVFGTTRVTGRGGISKLRKALWAKVKSMTHRIIDVCPYGSHSDLAMIHGFVDYELKNGVCKRVDFAAQCYFWKAEEVYLERYQVYMAEYIEMSKEAKI